MIAQFLVCIIICILCLQIQGIRIDNTRKLLFSFGNPTYGVLGNGVANIYPSEQEVKIAEGIEAIKAGDDHTLVLTKTGKVLSCGRNHKGQLGHSGAGDKYSTLAPVSFPGGKIKLIGADNHKSVAVTDTNKVYEWGTSIVHEPYSTLPVLVFADDNLWASDETIEDITVGAHHVLLKSNKNKLYAYGKNEQGSLGIGSTQQKREIVAVTQPWSGTIDKMATGNYLNAIIVKDGPNQELYLWGKDGLNGPRLTPEKVDLPGISSNQIKAIGVTDEKLILTFQDGATTKIGRFNNYDAVDELSLPSLEVEKVDKISCDGSACAFHQNDNRLVTWKDPSNHLLQNFGQFGENIDDNSRKYDSVTHFAIGDEHLFFSTSEEVKMFGIGSNIYGQLSQPIEETSVEAKPVSYPVESLTDTEYEKENYLFKSIAAGAHHAVVVDYKNRLFMWGYNGNKQLNQSHLISTKPILPSDVLGSRGIKVISVAAGTFHTIVLKDDNELMGFGKSQFVIGDKGTSIPDGTLIALKHDIKFDDLCANGEYSLARMKDDNKMLHLWGYLRYENKYVTNQHISFDEKIAAMSCGVSHHMALQDNGKLYVWGDGSSYKLGFGNENNILTPTLLETIPKEHGELISFHAGDEVSLLVLKGSNSFVALGVGSNEFGQLKTGTDKYLEKWEVIHTSTKELRAVSSDTLTIYQTSTTLVVNGILKESNGSVIRYDKQEVSKPEVCGTYDLEFPFTSESNGVFFYCKRFVTSNQETITIILTVVGSIILFGIVIAVATGVVVTYYCLVIAPNRANKKKSGGFVRMKEEPLVSGGTL